MSKNVAKMMPGQSHSAAWLLSATRLTLNSPPELQQTWAQINLNHYDYHSDFIEIS